MPQDYRPARQQLDFRPAYGFAPPGQGWGDAGTRWFAPNIPIDFSVLCEGGYGKTEGNVPGCVRKTP